MRAGDLQGMMVRTENGERIGRVAELHVRDGEVVSLTCGAAGLLRRFLASHRGRRVRWSDVCALDDEGLVVRR
jgi:sporulation protein YlmC with PRC-barrel domain